MAGKQNKENDATNLAHSIRELIMSGTIPIGAPLRQEELAKRFGTSRTPIREALKQLQATGLIEIQQNRGAFVRVPAPWEIREVYEIRAELEALATRKAATRLTHDQIETMRKNNDTLFGIAIRYVGNDNKEEATGSISTVNNFSLHSTIHKASNNVRLQQMLDDSPLPFPNNTPSLLFAENVQHRKQNHDEHEKILDALDTGDSEKAARLMRLHVLNSGEQIARWFELHTETVLTK